VVVVEVRKERGKRREVVVDARKRKERREKERGVIGAC
jgi:hypothetical protein